MPEDGLESVNNALHLLLMLKEGRPVRVTDASNRLRVARSTAHRLLATLERRGFVVQDPTTRAYLVGDAMIGFAPAVAREHALARAARPVLDELAKSLRETIHVTTLDGTEVTFVACAESSQTLRTGKHLGTRFAAHTTASGKALLAELPHAELRIRYADHPWKQQSKNEQSWSSLLTELETIRRRGYATNFAIGERGVTGIASPIKDSTGCYGALLMTAPSTRVGRRAAPGVGAQLTVAARRIAAALGSGTRR